MRRFALLSLVLACHAPEPASDPPPVDADGDGILDVHEGEAGADADGDGTPNFLDLDSDNDEIPDQVEAGDDDVLSFPVDADRDRVPDFLDLDSDGNGWPDAEEGIGRQGGVKDLDKDGVPDFRDLDNDGDGVPDVAETAGNRPLDTDNDGVPDLNDADSDDDGIPDALEGPCGPRVPCDSDADGVPDLRDLDSDNDGFSDQDEAGDPAATPWPAATDGDDLADYRDPDADGDGIPDRDEARAWTHPLLRDTDGDGLSDGLELDLGYDPTNAGSRYPGPVVEVPGREERSQGLAFDLKLDKVDFVWLNNRKVVYTDTVVDAVLAAGLKDPAIGAGVVGSYGVPGTQVWELPDFEGVNVPLHVLGRVGTDPSALIVETASLVGEPYRIGAWAKAGPEALRQVAAGVGFDLECDGVFEASEDLAPAVADPSDLFSGSAPSPGPEGAVGAFAFRPDTVRILLWEQTQWPVPGSEPPSWVDWGLAPFWDVESVGGCPPPPTTSEVGDALQAAGVFVVPMVYHPEELEVPPHGTNVNPTAELAARTRSLWDPDKDGVEEQYAIVVDLRVRATARALVTAQITDILQDISRRTSISHVRPTVISDPHGFVTGFFPLDRPDARIGDEAVPFDVLLRGAVPPVEGDQGFVIEVGVLADDWQVANQQVLVVVPGWGRP